MDDDDRDADVQDDDHDHDADGQDADIYIMMKCLSRKMSTFLKGPRSVGNVLSSLL